MLKHSTLAAVLILLGSTTAVIAKSDNPFLTEAIQINLAEIALGDLAQKNAGSEEAKAFGKMLVDDHTASNQKAMSLAQANGVTAPTEPKSEDKDTQQRLSKLSGADFDRDFAKTMVKGHKEAISKFEAASKGDDNVAKFAQETLPTLQKHLEQAQTLVKQETAAEDTQPKATETDQTAATSDKQSKSRATEMIGTLADGSVPLSDYYKQSVYDNHDNKIGDVNDILLGKAGKIEAVIIGVGGFLGIGEKSVAVPFSSLKVTEKNGSRYLVIETTKEALESAPGYVFDSGKRVWVPVTKQG
jgi:putative membrane protein